MQEQTGDKHYTYADYAGWDDGVRYELIEGLPHAMAPAPSPEHQRLSGSLHAQLWQFLRHEPCEVFAAPFDVRLDPDGADDTVVQPDLVIVCDLSKIDDKGYRGTPDMVIEILSQSSSTRDKLLKFNLYLCAGVREYWIIDPESRTVQVCVLKDGEYTVKAYGEKDSVPVHVLTGCVIDLGEVFAENSVTPP